MIPACFTKDNSGLLACEVHKPQQSPFRRQRVNACKKSLQSLEVGKSLRRNQAVFRFLSGCAPSFRNSGCLLAGVGHVDDTKSGIVEQPLVFSGRTEKVIADRAAGRNLLMREEPPTTKASLYSKHPPGFSTR